MDGACCVEREEGGKLIGRRRECNNKEERVEL